MASDAPRPTRLWRIAPARYDPLDGEGARRYGGRWTSPGYRAVYLAGSLPLAALEVLAHVDPDALPLDLHAFAVDVPAAFGSPADWAQWDAQVGDGGVSLTLPDGWREVAQPAACRAIGDAWLRASAAVRAGSEAARAAVSPLLRVPSAVLPAWAAAPGVGVDAGSWCAVLDPLHRAAGTITVAMHAPFTFDHRLLGRA